MKQQFINKLVAANESRFRNFIFVFVLLTIFSSNVFGQSVGSYSISNNGATGVNAQKTQLLDFTNYNNTTASTSAGQSFVFTLANGYKLSLIARNIGGTYLNQTALPTIGSGTLTPLGTTGYVGVGGKPALYMNGNYNVDIVFSGIALTDAAGNTIPNFNLALFDAERTGNGFVTETISGITNGGSWAAYESIGTGNFPTQTGIGTSTVLWTANTNTPVAAYAASTTNPTQVEVKMYGYEAFALGIYVPVGFVYVHDKHINEENAVDYTFTTKDNSGATVNTFGLNDQATANNTANSGTYIHVFDLGVCHGAGGDGEMWATAGNTATAISNTGAVSGTVYHRSVASSKWTSLSVTGVTAIDGAYAGQFVYSTSSGVFFYNNGTSTQIYTTGNTISDVTCNNGYIAMVTSSGAIYYYSNTYTPTAAPATGGTWTLVLNTSIAGTRIDMNLAATSIAYIKPGVATINAITLAGSNTSLGTAGTGATGSVADIAYDDNGYIYATCNDNSNGGTDVVASYNPGTATWTTELSTRLIQRLTGGASRQVYGVDVYLYPATFPLGIWYRALDNTGTAYWIDDERVKNSSSLNGNGIIIPVAPGTYTINETLPSSAYDLGRFNIYDPGNATSTNLVSNYAQSTIAADEVVYIEFVNEKLNAKAIALTCTQQILQSFDAGNGTGQFGTGGYGLAVEGSAYHYYNATSPADGYYNVVLNTSGTWYSNPGVTDHTGNGGYFLLVNASYAKDEFYRQRVTNLVPGLNYIISFYAANVSAGSPIKPNVTFGLQDLSGNFVNTATTGNITSATWTLFSFTFTATTSTADLYLKNVNIGGNGNDIGIDDISINPVILTLGPNTVSPTIAPNICLGTNYTFSNTQTGGIWAINPTSVAKINAKTGKVTGIATGNAIITYTYTNAIGCVSTSTSGVIVSTAPTIVVTDQLASGSVCLSQADSLYSSATGGTLPFTYSWSASPASGAGLTSINTQNTSFVATAANTYTYTVVVTDAVGCTGTGSTPLTVSLHTAPTVTTTGPNTCSGSAITNLKANASGGSGSYTYAWSAAPSGTSGLNAANNSLQSPNPTPTAAGIYSFNVTVNDGFCKVIPAAQTVTVYPVPTVVTSNDTTEFVCGNPSLTISSTPSGGTTPYTYSWSGSYVSGPDNGPGAQSPTNQQNLLAKPTITNSTIVNQDKYKYSVVVTDANGCAATNATNVNLYLFPTANAATVSVTPTSAQTICTSSTVSLGSTVSGGLTPYTYSWTGPNGYTSSLASPGNISPTVSGPYSLKVTTSQGCISTATTAQITVNPSPTVTASSYASALCFNGVDTVYSVASGGTAPYTYLWTVSGTSPIMTLAAPTIAASSVSGGNFGSTYTYTITAKDANNCTATNTTTVRSVSGNVNATGPTISNMPTAGFACLNSAKTLSPTATQGNGAITTYLWTGSPTGNGLGATNTLSTTITPTAIGSYAYTLKVTDANGCAASASTGIQTVNSAVTVAVASSAPGFCGGSGSVGLFSSANGGSGTYNNYAWATTVVTSPGSTSVNPASSTTSGSTIASILGATVGTSTFKYTATITDNNGCTGSGSSSILVTGGTPGLGSVTASSNSTCAGGTTVVNLSASYSGGTSPYNYSWTAPSNSSVTPSAGSASSSPVTATATATAAQNYVWGFAIQDANNCTATGNNTTLALNAGLTVSATSSNYSVCQTPATNINLTGTFTATTGPYTCAWAGSGVNNAATQNTTATPTSSGTYTITITDGAGCIGAATTPSSVVVDQAAPSISLTCGTNSNGINYGRFYEANGLTWYWTTASGGRFYPDNTLSTTNDSSTSSLQSNFVTYNGLYTVKITNAAGCVGTGNFTLTAGSCATTLTANDLFFTALKQRAQALLSWSSASETNNTYFEIQRSDDARIWQQIGTVKAAATSAVLTMYSFADGAPLDGTNYYRIKQMDNNGHTSYSLVRSLSFSNQWAVKMYPNPAQSFLLLQFSSNSDENGYVEIQDILGNKLMGNYQPIAKGTNIIKIDWLERLAQGIYIITLHTNNHIFREKFAKRTQ